MCLKNSVLFFLFFLMFFKTKRIAINQLGFFLIFLVFLESLIRYYKHSFYVRINALRMWVILTVCIYEKKYSFSHVCM